LSGTGRFLGLNAQQKGVAYFIFKTTFLQIVDTTFCKKYLIPAEHFAGESPKVSYFELIK
jgi:hypothetical protein